MRQRIEDVADSSSLSEVWYKVRQCDLRGLKRDFFFHFLGIRERNLVRGIQGSKLIDPFSPFHSAVELFLAFLLIYCAFIVPVQLSFWNSDDPCATYPTLKFDMFVDFCFILEVFYDFFVGMMDNRGNYIDSLSGVAWMQVSNPWLFWFGMATSVPVSWIDYHIAQLCAADGTGANYQSSQNVGILRAAKPLRLVKLVRLLRASKAYWVLVDFLDVNPVYPRVLKIVCMLSMSMHWCCCLLWRLKVETDRSLLDSWLADRGLVESDTGGCYILCISFVCTVFTTVGFGDIYALNTPERLFFMFLMLLAAFLFGTLIGELQELFAAMNKNARELEEYMDGVISFLIRNKVPVPGRGLSLTSTDRRLEFPPARHMLGTRPRKRRLRFARACADGPLSLSLSPPFSHLISSRSLHLLSLLPYSFLPRLNPTPLSCSPLPSPNPGPPTLRSAS